MIARRLIAAGAVVTLGLVGCAQVPVAPAAAPISLFQDTWFAASTAPPPTAAELFRLSPAMLDYAQRELGRTKAGRDTNQDPRRELINALYSTQRLQLQYDASTTRDAAQAFAARAGNCLSLVIMTAAFAKHLDLPVAYQAVDAPAIYSRQGPLTMASNHVNLVLVPPETRTPGAKTVNRGLEALTIDFLPQDETRGQRTQNLAETTIVAMYLNNRAVELMAATRFDEAYAHARAALVQDPGFVAAANTLGVIYSSLGRTAAAEAAFNHVLKADQNNIGALTNQVSLLMRAQRLAEAEPLASRLALLQPVPPFQHFNAGRAAMALQEFERARDLFVRELRLQPYQDEVHFWAAQAYWQLGNTERAAQHLSRAMEYSGNRSQQGRYAAKLAVLRGAVAPVP